MRTHPVRVGHLVVGLVFLGLAGSWALLETDLVGLETLAWLAPTTLVVAGVVGLVALFLRRSARE